MVRLRRAALYGALLLVILRGAEWFCSLVFGEVGHGTALILRWMLPITLCIFLNNIFGTQIL